MDMLAIYISTIKVDRKLFIFAVVKIVWNKLPFLSIFYVNLGVQFIVLTKLAMLISEILLYSAGTGVWSWISIDMAVALKRKLYTLTIIRQQEKLLLGLKKRGFGCNKINGFGGKVEKGESIKSAAIRFG